MCMCVQVATPLIIISFFSFFVATLHYSAWSHYGGVYIISARLSFRYEFTPVPSHGSVLVYMIPAQNLIPGRDSHFGTKTQVNVVRLFLPA